MFKILLNFFSKDIAIDLGTANTLFYLKGEGILLNEPSVVVLDKTKGKVLYVGKEAKEMLGKTPPNMEVIRPLKDGVISDYETTKAMISLFIMKVLKRKRLVKPRIAICVPAGITQVEKKAVIDSALQAGGREILLIEEPMAAAIGAGLDISAPYGNMVVDIGGGTTEVAVISLSSVAYSESVRVAGDEGNEAIMDYFKRKYNLFIGENTAEKVKIAIGSAFPLPEELSCDVSGRDMVSGIPRNITVKDDEIRDALKPPVEEIVRSVKRALEKTPPELSADILDKGIYLTGGGALLKGLDKLITEETGLKVRVTDDPLTDVAKGTGTAIEEYKKYRHYSCGCRINRRRRIYSS
jgi:rod shape-determining protein MreB